MLVKSPKYSVVQSNNLPFEIEQEVLKEQANNYRKFVGFFAGMGVLCPLSTLLLKAYLTNNSIASILIFGVANTGALLVSLGTLKQSENYLQTFENANKEVIKKSIAYDINYTLTLGKINAQRQLAYKLAELPIHEHRRWIDMLGLGGILPPPVHTTAVLDNGSDFDDLGSQRQSYREEDDIDELIQDFDYLEISDKQFVYESKAVFGNKGSGKSSYMAWEAIQFTDQFPNGRLFIGDIHYDSEDARWLPFVDEETLTKKIVATTPAQIFKIIKTLDQTLKDRKAGGIKLGKPECIPIKFIWDEVLGTLDDWDDNQREFAIKTLEKVQFQGRKYGIEITLGLHSLKKNKTDFDSSFFNNLTILALGTAIADNTIRYPSDFDIPKLLAELENTNALLPVQVDNNGQSFYPKGLGCVVRRKDKKPCIKVVPCITLPTRLEYYTSKNQNSSKNNIDGVEAISYLTQWKDELEDFPSDQAILDKWFEITGLTADTETLKYLKGLLI